MLYNWNFLAKQRKIYLVDHASKIEGEFRNIVGDVAIKALGHIDNSSHPWHQFCQHIISASIVDPFDPSAIGFYSQASQFLFFYSEYYSDVQKQQAIKRILSKSKANSLIFEHLIGMNYIWSNFYQVIPTNINVANHDFILKAEEISVGVECSVRYERFDDDYLIEKMKRKAKQLDTSIPNILAIHIPNIRYEELFSGTMTQEDFEKRVFNKLKKYNSTSTISMVLFSADDMINLGFYNPYALNKIPSHFPISPGP